MEPKYKQLTDALITLLCYDSEVRQAFSWGERVEIHQQIAQLFNENKAAFPGELHDKIQKIAAEIRMQGWQRPTVRYREDEFGKIYKVKN